MASGSIQFGGLATGLPSDLVDQLMQSQKSRLRGFESAKTKIADQQSIYNQLQTKLTDLSTKAVALQDASAWAPHTVSSSNEEKVTATGSDTAMAGTHTLHVAQLATHDTFVLGDATLTAGSGVSSSTDTLTAGSAFSYTYNGTTYGTSAGTTGFTDLTGKSLTDVAALINGIDYGTQEGVAASVMYDGGAYRLVLTAKDSGQNSGAARIAVGADTTLNFTTSGTLTSFQNTVPAQNAVFNLDGVNVTSTTNAPTDVLTGITLQLKSTTGATAQDTNADGINDAMLSTAASTSVVITVSNDTAAVKTTLDSFVEAYNGIVDFDAKHREGALAGSTLMRTVLGQMRATLNIRTHKSGATSATDYLPRSTLAEFGMRTDSKTGKISFSGSSLDDALKNDYSGLAAIFTNTQSSVGTGRNAGLAYRFETLVKGMTNSVTGSLTAQTNGFRTRTTRLDKDIEREGARLEKVRQQLTLKFSNLEQMVSKMNSAGSAMNSALSKL
ncbi:MAG: flagellar filament capping protein FliD [Magnetococcales bacterium]|nr:flagellar filament capping protein FliD [Magnetococcales bacterium]